MTVRVCSHRPLLQMQSDVLNEQQQQQQQAQTLSNDTDCSPSLSTTTLIYSGLKLHPKTLVPTISMPGVASPLSIVKKLSIPEAHLENTTKISTSGVLGGGGGGGTSLRHSSTSTTNSSSSIPSTTTTTNPPSSIRLVTPTGKLSPTTAVQLQLVNKSVPSASSSSSSSSGKTTNGGFSTSKAFIFNPQTSSTTTVNKQQQQQQQLVPSSTPPSPSLLTFIPPATTTNYGLTPSTVTSPKIQTLNSVTISSTNEMATTTNDLNNSKSSSNSNTSNPTQPLFLSKNRLTLVQPLITNPTVGSTSSTNSSTSNTIASKLVIQQGTTPATNATFWPQSQQQQTQTAKIFSIPPSSILPTTKMLSRPVQLIPTSLSSSEHHHSHHHHHHHPQITHVQTVKTDKSETIPTGTNTYPISMQFGLSSPTTGENPTGGNFAPLSVQVPHHHSFTTKNLDSGHQAYIHMSLLPSTTSSSDSTSVQQHPLQFTLPTHFYSRQRLSPSFTIVDQPTQQQQPSTPVLISTTQRTMDHNNNHSTTITTPIVREMTIDEKVNDSLTPPTTSIIKSSSSSTIKNASTHHHKSSSSIPNPIKGRPRLPLQPSTQQISSSPPLSTLATAAALSSASSSSSSTATIVTPLLLAPPSTSSFIPTTNIRQPKKHKLLEEEQISVAQPPNKLAHYEQFDSSSQTPTLSKKSRKPRMRPLSKVSIENTTPSISSPSIALSSIPLLTSSIGVGTTGLSVKRTITGAKKRHSAESAAAALAAGCIRRRRAVPSNGNGLYHGTLPSPGVIKKQQQLQQQSQQQQVKRLSENVKQEPMSIDDRLKVSEPGIDEIDDELLRRLSQDFVYIDKRTGIRWIGSKTRPPINALVSRIAWKPKINHYEKYSDFIRSNPKRLAPVKNVDTIRKKLDAPWASWRIDRLTSYLSDLTHDEQMTQVELSDIAQSLDQLNIHDRSIRNTIEDLLEANIQRHRCFAEQLTQTSTLLVALLDHGQYVRNLCTMSKSSSPLSLSNNNNNHTPTRRTKER